MTKLKTDNPMREMKELVLSDWKDEPNSIDDYVVRIKIRNRESGSWYYTSEVLAYMNDRHIWLHSWLPKGDMEVWYVAAIPVHRVSFE